MLGANRGAAGSTMHSVDNHEIADPARIIGQPS